MPEWHTGIPVLVHCVAIAVLAQLQEALLCVSVHMCICVVVCARACVCACVCGGGGGMVSLFQDYVVGASSR